MNKTLKSILSLVLCVCFVLALSACGKQNNDTTANNTDTNVSNNNVTDDNTDDSADITPEESTAGDSNILVAYFSWSGNTQQVANWISDKTGGELFRIIPEVEYTEDDVFDRAQDELNNGTTLACFRGYADCVNGAKEMGVIYGTGVYEKGKVLNTPAMAEAYEMGKNV